MQLQNHSTLETALKNEVIRCRSNWANVRDSDSYPQATKRRYMDMYRNAYVLARRALIEFQKKKRKVD